MQALESRNTMLGGMIEQFGLDDDFEGPVTIINWTKTRR